MRKGLNLMRMRSIEHSSKQCAVQCYHRLDSTKYLLSMVLLSDGCKSDREFWRLCSAICTRNRPGANGRASVLIHPAVEAHLTLFGRRRRLTVRRRTVPVPATEGCGGFSSASATYQWNTGRSTPNSTKEYWSTGVTFPSWCP